MDKSSPDLECSLLKRSSLPETMSSCSGCCRCKTPMLDANNVDYSAPNWIKDFLVVGQGTIVFSADAPSPFSIVVRPKIAKGELGSDQWVSLEVLSNEARFIVAGIGDSEENIVLKQVKGILQDEKVGYEPGRKIKYWFSYDRDRLVLKYGKGYRMEETTLMTFNFLAPRGIPVEDPDRVRHHLKYLFSPTVRRQIEHYDLHYEGNSLNRVPQLPLQHLHSESSPADKMLQLCSENDHVEGNFHSSMPQVSFSFTVAKKGLCPKCPYLKGAFHPFLQDCCSCTCVKREILVTTAGESTSMQCTSVHCISKEMETLLLCDKRQVADQNSHHLCFERRDCGVMFDSCPFVCNWPPFVKDSSDVSLLDLDCGRYTLSASLPPACQELYTNISSNRIDLNFPVEPDGLLITDAIRYSMSTNGMLLYEKLQEKKGDFGCDNEVYLRVTLGPNRASSPGIPYVLEIWPKSCGSPIHNHGNSFAVIKVLHGGLSVQIFNQHADHNECQPLKTFTVSQGDVTWISPYWYQTHKLWNNTNDYCATLQCYKYGMEDVSQWPFFDYISAENTVAEFLPNTDFTFSEMREKVLTEYRSHVLNQQNRLNA